MRYILNAHVFAPGANVNNTFPVAYSVLYYRIKTGVTRAIASGLLTQVVYKYGRVLT